MPFKKLVKKPTPKSKTKKSQKVETITFDEFLDDIGFPAHVTVKSKSETKRIASKKKRKKGDEDLDLVMDITEHYLQKDNAKPIITKTKDGDKAFKKLGKSLRKEFKKIKESSFLKRVSKTKEELQKRGRQRKLSDELTSGVKEIGKNKQKKKNSKLSDLIKKKGKRIIDDSELVTEDMYDYFKYQLDQSDIKMFRIGSLFSGSRLGEIVIGYYYIRPVKLVTKEVNENSVFSPVENYPEIELTICELISFSDMIEDEQIEELISRAEDLGISCTIFHTSSSIDRYFEQRVNEKKL